MNTFTNFAAGLAIAAGPFFAAPSAHAQTFQCNNFVQNTGYAGHNPPATATIIHTGGGWSVYYQLQNGQAVDRSTQFTLTENSDNTKTEWSGYSLKDGTKWMRGALRKRNADGHILYMEELYQNVAGVTSTLATNTIDCGLDSTAPQQVAPAPTYVAPAPAPATVVASSPATVALVSTAGGLDERVSVIMGSSQSLIMVIDTGAMLGSVPQSIADALIANNEAVEAQAGVSILADGSRVNERRVVIKRIVIGGHEVDNILMSVCKDGEGMPLLGMTVLAKFGRFSIDVQHSTLTLG